MQVLLLFGVDFVFVFWCCCVFLYDEFGGDQGCLLLFCVVQFGQQCVYGESVDVFRMLLNGCEWWLQLCGVWQFVEFDDVDVFWYCVFDFVEGLQYFDCYLVVCDEDGGDIVEFVQFLVCGIV